MFIVKVCFLTETEPPERQVEVCQNCDTLLTAMVSSTHQTVELKLGSQMSSLGMKYVQAVAWSMSPVDFKRLSLYE